MAFLSLFGMAAISHVHASANPMLTLAPLNTGSVQISVAGPAFAPIQLYYYNQYNQMIFVSVIGTTDGSGYFTTTVPTTQYGIPGGSFVVVSFAYGVNSPPVAWPSYYSYQNPYPIITYPTPPVYTPPYQYYIPPQIYLSQTSLNLPVGQNSTVTISSNTYYDNNYGYNGGYYISSNSNPFIANVSVNGNLIYIHANNPGSTSISICQYGGTCARLYVNVLYQPQPVYTPYPVTYPWWQQYMPWRW
ncbi:MAG: hypothetical protein WCQ60_00020 [bacterium]